MDEPIEELNLRDYFAAKAIMGLAPVISQGCLGWTASLLAENAYKIADAMLVARES